jgi:predicted secreted protein
MIPAAADVVATGADNGKSVRVPLGEPLTVKLTGKKGSGYYWRLDADLTPELVLSGRTTSSVDLPGAEETTSFTFTTTAVGMIVFKASYLKPGAPLPKNSDIQFSVVVTP